MGWFWQVYKHYNVVWDKGNRYTFKVDSSKNTFTSILNNYPKRKKNLSSSEQILSFKKDCYLRQNLVRRTQTGSRKCCLSWTKIAKITTD